MDGERARLQRRNEARPRAAREPRDTPALPVDRLLELQRGAGNQAVTRLLQRAVVHGADQVVQDRNLAATILAGGANGITPPLVNGTEMPVPNGMAAAAERALNKPTISVEREGFFSGNYRARVTGVPTNTISGRAYIPQNPPWVVPAAEAPRVVMNGLGGGGGAGVTDLGPGTVDTLDRRDTTRFAAHGDAGDAVFLAAIRAHELHHANDHWLAAQAIVGPWDRALKEQMDDGRVHEAPTKDAARAKVYTEASATPAELATALERLWVQLDSDFHATHEGRRSDVKRFSVSNDGSTVDAYYDY